MTNPSIAIVRQALDGRRGDDQRRIAEQAIDIVATLMKKNADYGSSVFKRPMLAPQVDAGDAILCRLSDKVERFANLNSADRSAQVDESLEETLGDLVGYALLWLARPPEERRPIGFQTPAGFSARDMKGFSA